MPLGTFQGKKSRQGTPRTAPALRFLSLKRCYNLGHMLSHGVMLDLCKKKIIDYKDCLNVRSRDRIFVCESVVNKYLL